MGAPFRPANLVVGAASWNSAATTFDLAGVKGDLIAGVLRQWATAPHLRAEIARAAKSSQGFARRYGASVNHLRNMLNGHRLPDYPTLAQVLMVAGHQHALDEKAIADAVVAALQRSAKRQGLTNKFAGIFAEDLFGWETTGPSGSGETTQVADTHPDTRLIRSTFTRAVLADPLVIDYLSADHPRHPDDPDGLRVEVTVEVAANDDEVSVEGFITSSLIAGSLRVPEDWKTSVYETCGGVLGGVLVCAAVESGPAGIMQFIGSQIYVEAGESREEWDLAFIDKRATLGEDGEVTWRG